MGDSNQTTVGAARRWLIKVGSAFGRTYRNWRRNRTIRLGAGLAYYGVFALIPLVSLCFFLAGLVFSRDDVQSFISDHLADTAQGPARRRPHSTRG